MDTAEQNRRARAILRNIEATAKKARARLTAAEESPFHREDCGTQFGSEIGELGAMFEDALHDVDISSEKDQRRSRTRKVRRAFGYTVP